MSKLHFTTYISSDLQIFNILQLDFILDSKNLNKILQDPKVIDFS